MTDKLEKLEKLEGDLKSTSSAVVGIAIVGGVSTLLAVTTLGLVAIGQNELMATAAAVAWMGTTLWAGGGLFIIVLSLDVMQSHVEALRREIGGQK